MKQSRFLGIICSLIILVGIQLISRPADAQTLHITGFVFNDFNGDGFLDPNENPISNPAAQFPDPGNAIWLFDSHNNLVAIAAGNAPDGYSDIIIFTIPEGAGGIWTVRPNGIPGYHVTLPSSGEYPIDTTQISSTQTINVTANFGFSNLTTVPEPGSLALLCGILGPAAAILIRRRK